MTNNGFKIALLFVGVLTNEIDSSSLLVRRTYGEQKECKSLLLLSCSLHQQADALQLSSSNFFHQIIYLSARSRFRLFIRITYRKNYYRS